ncbi:MAG: YqiA/YcfP family alpha/beta fold hydrolase, partial [Burkholderiales bacterium]
LVVPELPPDPTETIAIIDNAVAGEHKFVFIGSSLGGYYATYIAERYRLKAALINPAVRPYQLLKNFLGPQKNLYTGEEFVVTENHLETLRQIDVARISDPARYLVLLASGDEVLDHREALAKYRGAKQIVIDGGDHSLQSFEEYIPRIVEFAAN